LRQRRLSAADDEHGFEPVGELRHVGRLKRTRGDHDLVGRYRPVIELEDEASLASLELSDIAVQLDRQLEVSGVPLEICDHLIPRGIAVRIAREGKPR
jgi:hypothetical protein